MPSNIFRSSQRAFRIPAAVHLSAPPRRYNPAKAIPGEAAPNPIDIWFTLTTELHGGGIRIVAPKGFHFPQVCRYFSLDIMRADHPEVEPLPAGSVCSADGMQTLSIDVPSNPIYVLT